MVKLGMVYGIVLPPFMGFANAGDASRPGTATGSRAPCPSLRSRPRPGDGLVGFRPTPLKNDGVKVSWDDEIPNVYIYIYIYM